MNVFDRDRIVVADRLPDQALRVVLAHSRQVLHQQFERVLLAFDRRAVLALPQLRFRLDQLANFIRGRQRQRETRAHALQLGRNLDLLAEEHQRASGLVVLLRDFLDQPHVDRILEIRLRVEHGVDAVLRRLVDVAQRRLKFVRLRDHVGTRNAADAVGDAPDEERPTLEIRDSLQELHHAHFFAGFHQHQRKTRLDDQCQITKVIGHALLPGVPAACRVCRRSRHCS